MNGFINVCKPVDMTASDVVVKIRRLTNSKTGHFGTLDPGAAGVLPIGVGKGVKLFNFLIDKSKTYRANFTFGVITDTLDSYGKIIETSDNIPTVKDINLALSSFLGEIPQMPPQYSAKSVNGVRAYKLARKGETAELTPKKVTVTKFELIGQTDEKTFSFDIECGAGTYIRALARDLAQKLDTVAYMSSLIRLSSGAFNIEDSYTLDELNSDIEAKLLPLDYPLFSVEKIDFDISYYKLLANGVKFSHPSFNGYKRIYCDNVFFGLASCKDERLVLEYNLAL
ncbi:MAG TPA: tRNA pseudouridine(55) synthase TruB [Eubacteriales bacterium]|nr:tRNA pseudouridine(55) synthase TruB [Eubacteriales bacterium]